jgi:hypothetical protein
MGWKFHILWARPDIWQLSVVGGPTLLYTTFANNDDAPWQMQAYPGNYPSANNPIRSGAYESNTLGYLYPLQNNKPTDDVYGLSFTFDHSSNEVIFLFAANLTQWGYPIDERWGIDNISVSTNSTQTVPEPSSSLLLSIGIVVVILMTWR